MLFKYPMHSRQGDETWVVLDGFDEINYQQGWLTAIEAGEESDGNEISKAWTFGFSEDDPKEHKPGELHSLVTPDEIYVPDTWYKSLIERQTKGITAMIVTLRKNRDAKRIMIVSQAYLLNDDGRTVERLYPRVPV